jgi:hypothetical protein
MSLLGNNCLLTTTLFWCSCRSSNSLLSGLLALWRCLLGNSLLSGLLALWCCFFSSGLLALWCCLLNGGLLALWSHCLLSSGLLATLWRCCFHSGLLALWSRFLSCSHVLLQSEWSDPSPDLFMDKRVSNWRTMPALCAKYLSACREILFQQICAVVKNVCVPKRNCWSSSYLISESCVVQLQIRCSRHRIS